MKTQHRHGKAFRACGIAGAILGTAVLTSVAWAQQPPQPVGGLEEVIVTAQKRAQNSQDVGIALSAVTGDDLAKLGAVSASDITKTMPAVVLTQPNGPSSFSLSVRGVTQNDFADHQESPAAIYVDDVYVSQMAGLAFSMFDMDRVEVLRGPQGTLFGRNATGGLANFVTRRPSDETGGYFDVTFGQRNLTRIEGAVTGPLWDGVDGRFSFQSNHYDPLFHNVAGGAPNGENGNDWGVRAQLLFKDIGGGELLLSARTSREDVHAGSWEQFAVTLDPNGVDRPVGPNENFWLTCNGCNASGLPASGAFTTNNNAVGYAMIKTSGVTAKFTDNLGFATFTAIADFSALKKDYQEDSDASPYTLFQFFNGSDVTQESLELRLNGGDQKLNWTAGLYGLNIDGHYYEGWQGPVFFDANEYITDANTLGAWPNGNPATWATGGALADSNGGLPATRAPYDLTTKSYALFGQLEYRATDLIGLTLGGRVTRDKKDYEYSWYPYLYYPNGLSAPTPLTRPAWATLQDYRNSRSDNLFSGKAQVDFHVAPNALLYVSYNRGVKGGGFTAPLFPTSIGDLATLTFKPETLTSYEVGIKSEFFNHTLRVNGAAYYYDYKDYQALIYTVSLEQLIVNADAKHEGAEVEVEWAPNEQWLLGAGLSYVDAIVKNVGGRLTPSYQLIPGDYTAPNAPRWSGDARVRYTLPVPGGAKLAFQVDGNYLSRFWFNLADTPAVEQGPYGVTNFRANYTPASGKFEIGVSVDNVADRHYAAMGFDNVGINGLAQRYPGMPRWFKAHVNYKF